MKEGIVMAKKNKKDNLKRPDKIKLSRSSKMDDEQLFLQMHMMRKGGHVHKSKANYQRRPKHQGRPIDTW